MIVGGQVSSVFCCGKPSTSRLRGCLSVASFADGRASARTGLMGIHKHGICDAARLHASDQAHPETDLSEDEQSASSATIETFSAPP